MLKYIKLFENFNKKIEYPKFVDKLYAIYSQNGYSLYIVGGCVRDAVLNKTPKDFDLATDAPISKTIELLNKNNIDFNEQGKSFGIVVAYDGKDDYEIAQFRSDIVDRDDYIEFASNYDNNDEIVDIINTSEDYRSVLAELYPDFIEAFDHNLRKNQKVKLGVTIDSDAERRDLSINALYYDIGKQEIIDLVGGLDDLKNNVIRMVGKPSDRIKEDRLRILRVGRFLARMDGTLDKELATELKNNNNISSVSYERIWDELVKSFSTAKNINKYIDFITEYKLINQFLFKFNLNKNIFYTNNIILYLSSILYNTNLTINITNDLVKFSKIPYDIASKVNFLISFVNMFKPSNVFNFYKQKNQFKVSDDLLIDFCRFLNKTEYVYKFVEYKPSYDIVKIASDNNIILDANNKPRNAEDGRKLGQLINKFEEGKFNEI